MCDYWRWFCRSMQVCRKVKRITIQENTWKRQWQESVMCMTTGTQQPQRAQGCSLQFVGWPREKHVLYVSGLTTMGNKWQLWLSQNGDSTMLVFPHQRADTCGDMWQSQAHSKEELFGLCQGSFRWHSSVLSVLEAHREAEGVSSTPVFKAAALRVVSRYVALRSQSALGTAGPAQPCPTVQPEPRLLRKCCESHQDTRIIKVQPRIGLLTQGCSAAQGSRRENGWVWAPEGRKQAGWSGSTVKPVAVRLFRLPAWVTGVGIAGGKQQLWDIQSWPFPSWWGNASKGSTGAAAGSRPQPDSSFIPTCPSWAPECGYSGHNYCVFQGVNSPFPPPDDPLI